MGADTSSLLNVATPILIVDDNPQYSQLLKKILIAAFGYSEITCVESLEAASALVFSQSAPFLLYFVDYRFPGSARGTDFLLQLQKGGYLEKAVAFLITSEPTPENAKVATAHGAYGVVAKPFDREELRRQIEGADRLIKVSRDSF